MIRGNYEAIRCNEAGNHQLIWRTKAHKGKLYNGTACSIIDGAIPFLPVMTAEKIQYQQIEALIQTLLSGL